PLIRHAASLVLCVFTSFADPSLLLLLRCSLGSPLFPYTTLFRSGALLLSGQPRPDRGALRQSGGAGRPDGVGDGAGSLLRHRHRSEEHTSELQSRFDVVCRLLLEKKKRPWPGHDKNDRYYIARGD